MNYRQLQFCTPPDQIDLSQLQQLFSLTAVWAQKRPLEDLKIAIANSEPVVTVSDGEKMIGFARAISDGVYRAIIWDIVVHPHYREVGLSHKLVETILSHPRMNRVERVYLMTTNQQHFYQQIGFQCNSSTTMVLYNHSLINSCMPLTAEVS